MRLSNVIRKLAPLFLLALICTVAAACADSEEQTAGTPFSVHDEEFMVLPLQTMTVAVSLEAGQLLTGDITVTGGKDDILVYIKDDFGEQITDFGTIAGTKQIAYRAVEPGFYTVCFDNSFSAVVNKQIKFHYTVR